MHRRAEAIAAPRIAEGEREAATRIVCLAADHAQKRERLKDLAGEFRQQLTVVERGWLRRSYAACHLPRPVRRLIDGMCQRVDAAAAIRPAPRPPRR